MWSQSVLSGNVQLRRRLGLSCSLVIANIGDRNEASVCLLNMIGQRY